MTAPANTTREIEHQGHDILCEGVRHAGPPAPADYRCMRHTCPEILLCSACVNHDLRNLAEFESYRCEDCGLVTATLHDMITVVPL